MPDWTREISQRLELAGQPVDADILEELAQHAANASVQSPGRPVCSRSCGCVR